MCLCIIIPLSACNSSTSNEPNTNDSITHIDNGTNENNSQTNSELSPFADWDDDGALKILTIGNSFSNNTMAYVYQIAEACGVKEIYLGNLYISGCTLDTHAENARGDKKAYAYYYNKNGVWLHANDYKMSSVIQRENWDFISLQQASSSSDKPETYGELEYLISYVKSLADKNSTLIWNMTWAYDRSKNSRQNYMYTHIVSSVKEKVEAQSDFAAIIPCGTAIQNARTSFVGDTMTTDGMHLNTLGQYIAGLTLVHKLTGLSIDNISYSAGLTDNKVAVAIESVKNAVAKPYEITKSVLTK